MTMAVKHTCGTSRQAAGKRLSGLAVLLAVAVIGAGTLSAAGDESVTGVGIAIPETARARLITSFEQRTAIGGDGKTDGEAVVTAEVAELRVAANTPDWAVAVRFTLPGGGKPKHRNAAARCSLVDEAGVVISEQLIENGEVLLMGNGKRGYSTLFLQVVGISEVLGIERLTEPMVEVEGRATTGAGM
jgi:hypothetical protein